MIKSNRFLLIFFASYCCQLGAMVYDNRFFPLYRREYSRTCEFPSAFMVDFFIMTAHEAFTDDDKGKGIPEIFGPYNENRVADAIVKLGNPNPLPPNLRDRNLLWTMDGKFEGEGVAVQYWQHFWKGLYGGFSFFFMHNFSRINFAPIPGIHANAQELSEADLIRRQMNDELFIKAPTASQFGPSDIDVFLRYGHIWEYVLRNKRIDAGVYLGGLIPSGTKRDINNPASVPFGGDGHWGIYVAADAEFELKEDWKVGTYLRLNKRFARTSNQRIVIAQEQPLWGAVIGPVRVNPGVTFAWTPYVRLDGMQDGLGVMANYTLVIHAHDSWTDKRVDPVPPAEFEQTIATSDWFAEYVTVNIFYDLGKVKERCFKPLLYFKWDIPIDVVGAHSASKTNRISFGAELNY